MANEHKKVDWIRIDGGDASTANLKEDILEQCQHKIEQCREAVAAARENGDRHEEGIQLIKLGQACKNLGQIKGAIESYEQALSIFQERGDQLEEANCHTHLGEAYLFLLDAENVLAHHLHAGLQSDGFGRNHV